jgi:predicted transposase/invertase (TIGR01784 family)
LFETAEIAKFTPDQVRSYEDSLKYYRDLKNSLDTAREEGKIEGKIEGKLEIASRALKKGLSRREIAELTGLTEDEIRDLEG